MTAFFDKRITQLALLQEARSWVHTPFFPFARVKGHGVDCVNLAAGIYLETGVINGFHPPPYSMDGGSHLAESALEKFIESQYGQLKKLDLSEPLMPGDLLCFEMGRVSHHVGLVTEYPLFLTTFQGVPVRELDLRDPTWSKRLIKAYRPVV